MVVYYGGTGLNLKVFCRAKGLSALGAQTEEGGRGVAPGIPKPHEKKIQKFETMQDFFVVFGQYEDIKPNSNLLKLPCWIHSNRKSPGTNLTEK
jgi:hypothetical protein